MSAQCNGVAASQHGTPCRLHIPRGAGLETPLPHKLLPHRLLSQGDCVDLFTAVTASGDDPCNARAPPAAPPTMLLLLLADLAPDGAHLAAANPNTAVTASGARGFGSGHLDAHCGRIAAANRNTAVTASGACRYGCTQQPPRRQSQHTAVTAFDAC